MRWNKKKRHFVPWAVRNPDAYFERWYREHGLGYVWNLMKIVERQKVVAQQLATSCLKPRFCKWTGYDFAENSHFVLNKNCFFG